jgi:hypothetical protein
LNILSPKNLREQVEPSRGPTRDNEAGDVSLKRRRAAKSMRLSLCTNLIKVAREICARWIDGDKFTSIGVSPVQPRSDQQALDSIPIYGTLLCNQRLRLKAAFSTLDLHVTPAE